MPVQLRWAARTVAVLGPVLLVLATTGPAAAAPPISWPQPEELSTLEMLGLVLGAPVALMVVITLLVMAPSIAKGTNQRTHVPWYAEPIIFGTAPADQTSTDVDIDSVMGGGASVRW